MNCLSCKENFHPKLKGYNAKYCSDKCKRRSQRKRIKENNPQQLIDQRRRSYLATKAHPDRFKKHLESARASSRKTRQWLADFKMKSGCVDCGYNEHSAALQLDHEGKKSIEIADARSSIARLKKEIKDGDCKVRCANCHSVRTWKNKQPTSETALGAKNEP